MTGDDEQRERDDRRSHQHAKDSIGGGSQARAVVRQHQHLTAGGDDVERIGVRRGGRGRARRPSSGAAIATRAVPSDSRSARAPSRRRRASPARRGRLPYAPLMRDDRQHDGKPAGNEVLLAAGPRRARPRRRRSPPRCHRQQIERPVTTSAPISTAATIPPDPMPTHARCLVRTPGSKHKALSPLYAARVRHHLIDSK